MSAAVIKANKAKLFALDNAVNDNKMSVYDVRHQIEENRGLILKNYSAIFGANRAMGDNASARILKNRHAALDSMNAETPAGQDWINIMHNEAVLDSLEHRAKLTTRMADVNSRLSQINALLIECNEIIMEGNASVLEFNDTQFGINSQLLSGELKAADATDESNNKRIEVNTGRIASLTAEAAEKKKLIDVALDTVGKNHASIVKNTQTIYARREAVIAQNKRASDVTQKIIAAAATA